MGAAALVGVEGFEEEEEGKEHRIALRFNLLLGQTEQVLFQQCVLYPR